MKIIIFRELTPYTYKEVTEKIGILNEEFDQILNQMLRNRIVKQVLTHNHFTLEELSDVSVYLEPISSYQNSVYVFTYVGILMVRNTCIIIYPKYLHNYIEDQNDNFKLMKQILAVIRKYKSKEQYLRSNTLHNQHSNFNYLSIAYEIIQDYEINGLYITEKQITELNGSGEVLWEKTVLESNMILTQHNPIYLDLYTQKFVTNEEDYFYQLHKSVVSQAMNKIKDVANLLELPNNTLNATNLENFGSKDYILIRINQELTRQFITTKVNTLNLMKRYIEECSSDHNYNDISFVGTSSFNLVWEDVCATVLKDCKQHTMRELGLKYSKLPKGSLLAQVIATPKWTHSQSGAKHYAKKTYIPDIVNIKDNRLSIFDAKYYDIFLNENNLNKYPGIESITKQYMYELAFQEFASENKLIIVENAFVFPNASDEEVELGTASLDFFQSMGLKDINIILKPCRIMFDKYLQT